MKVRSPPPWTWLLALFAASFALIHAWSGGSPAPWVDTVNDQREVRQCVLEGSCSLLGQASSVDGLFIAAGWLDFRALLFAWGVGLDGVHQLLQALEALGVVLVAIAGLRLGGRPAAAAAAYVSLLTLGEAGVTHTAVYNVSLMTFLGAVMLLACVAAVERRGAVPVVVAALLAAVVIDCHAAATPVAATVVWVAVRGPGRRVWRVVTAGVLLPLATFLLAPLGWLENARFLLHRAPPTGGLPHGVPLLSVLAMLRADPIACCALVVACGWLLALVARCRPLRHALEVPFGTVAPMLVALACGLQGGLGDGGGRYLVQIKPAAALGVALLAASVARWVVARLGACAPPAWLLAVVAPWALVLAIAVTASRVARHDAVALVDVTQPSPDVVAGLAPRGPSSGEHASAAGSAGDAATCLGPGVSDVLQRLSQSGALGGEVASGYRLERLDAHGNDIEMGYVARAGDPVTVVLTLAHGSATGSTVAPVPFDVRLIDDAGHASDAERVALFQVAETVGRAIPASVLRYCGGAGAAHGREREGSRLPELRAPRAFGIGAGVAEVMVMIAAIVLGVLGPRRGRRSWGLRA